MAMIVEKVAPKLAAGVLALGAVGVLCLERVVQWEGVLAVEQDCWAVKVGLAIGLTAAVGWARAASGAGAGAGGHGGSISGVGLDHR